MSEGTDKKLDDLFATARRFRPDTSIPENRFETRLMARIQENRLSRSTWFFWELRLVPVIAVLVLILGSIAMLMDAHQSQDILLSIARSEENRFIVRYLIGG